MHAWNEDPGSRVDLVLRSDLNSPAPAQEADGVNAITYEDPHDEIDGKFEPSGGVLAINFLLYLCGAGTQAHAIPGDPSADALPIVESNIVTQDGYGENWAGRRSDSRQAHEQIMGHELGHGLGLGHSCGGDGGPACDPVTGQALMRGTAHLDGRGADLNSDDQAAVRYLYPEPGFEEPDPDPDPDPDPNPDPDPGPVPYFRPPTGEGYTDCAPTAAALSFPGVARVYLCYETPAGEAGDARTGIWQSSEAGLLWFFNRDNAEVLIKVLNGCGINGHRWVFVAPVTDVAFNLYVVDSEGRTWPHHNRQGQTAEARSDTFAFNCFGP